MDLFSNDNCAGAAWNADGRWAVLTDEEVYQPGLTRVIEIRDGRATDNLGASGPATVLGSAVLVDFVHSATGEAPETYERLVLRERRHDDWIEGSRYWEDEPLPDGDLNRLWQDYYESDDDALFYSLPSALEVVFIREAELAGAADPFEDLGEWGLRGSAIV